MSRTKASLLALGLTAALPFAASAQSASALSYNYVEGGYIATNADLDADGAAARGSVAFHPNFHVFGGFQRQDVDNTPVDFDEWRIGIGYNHAISPNADLVTRVAYEKFDAGRDIFGNDYAPDGYSVEVGLRGALAPQLEGYAMAGYEDFGNFYGDDFYGRLGAQWKFTPNWGVSGDVKFAGGDTQWFVGPRFTW
ncbi:Ax21 family protein [Luteimonas yindakuii]|uniref:diffusible signal factor-reguated Ax21 faimly protein n=1 Tax=Luteimonas yindakuii TaxID=2565782 RepID=UPI0010A4C2F7|nr:diffusible signal factor-reguated Ax21 faimly protein [Luteimonas yindakuii]QCO66740.1 Ax21 family protein [Luteimonas yindakuii]